MDALYFAVTTQTSVGYGDISPRSTLAKIFGTKSQSLNALVFLFKVTSSSDPPSM